METIQMLGSLGEFVGAIAVVATLVYLAIQVRHSKEAMEANTKSLDEGRKLALAQTYQARSDALQQMHMFLAASQELCEITEKINPERASEEEYYTSGIQGPMAFFAPGWKVLGIVDDGSRRPSFRAELEKALAERDAHTHRRF